MRAYEPSLVVSSAGAKEVDTKVNFTVEHLNRLQKLELLGNKPHIAKGYVQGKGQMFAVCIQGQVHMSPDFDAIQAKVERFWSKYVTSAPFQHLVKIYDALKAKNLDWPGNEHHAI
jgi:hypothetical protein